jgi:hypothetical protein
MDMLKAIFKRAEDMKTGKGPTNAELMAEFQALRRQAVDKVIAREKIPAREADSIHRLLRGRH